MTCFLHFFSWILLLSLLYLVDCYTSLNCNPNVESLFVEDPTDRQAFFSCRPYGNYPSIGFWSRHYCPNDMHFEYNSQQCTTTEILAPNTVREANDLLRIAILNGSCAHGEQCIGGTVCDPIQQRCLCPYGTVALLETLFCAKLLPPVGNLQQQYSYGGQYPSQVPLQSTQGTATSLSPSLSSLGSYCDHESCEHGATCINSVCVCPGKTRNNGTNCTSNPSNIPPNTGQQQQITTKELFGQGGSFFKAKLGEQCNEYLGLFCSDQSSMCVNGYCQCVPPMVEQQGQCQMIVREAGPGELCNSGQVCIKGSVCNQEIPLCVCPKGTELEKGKCVERDLKKTLNEEKIDEKKLSFSSSTEPTTKISNKIKMRPSLKIEAKVGEECSLNADCASGSYCNGNTQPPTCQCLSTHISVNNHCEKVIYPGQKGCETDLQCSAGYAGARCLNGQCACPPGSSAIEQTCIPAIAWPGEACNITHFMPVCSADSFCLKGFCVCNPTLKLIQKQCIKLNKVKKVNKEEEKRRRRKGFLLKLKKFGNKKRRRRKRKLKEEEKEEQQNNGRNNLISKTPTFRLIGSKCRQSIDHCSVGAECQNSQCVCIEGSFPDAQKRLCRQNPGGNCTKGQLCTNRSECILGKCTCRKGLEIQHFGNFNKCNEISKNPGKMPLAGQLCIDKKCAKGAICQNGICACLKGYNLFNGECLPPRASLGGTNTFHEHSLLFSPSFPLMDTSSFETAKYKEIKENNNISGEDEEEEDDTLPIKTVVTGAPCRLSLECPYRTECLRGVCRCKRGETIVNGVCRKAIHEVLPGGRCDTQNGVDCIGESHCFYGICVCLYGLIIASQECANSAFMNAVRPGEKCFLGQRCSGMAKCVRSICQCPKGQKTDNSGGCFTPFKQSKKNFESKRDDENQQNKEVEDVVQQQRLLPNLIIPAALLSAAEEKGGGKFNQILNANQMSINLMDTKSSLRSLFGSLLMNYYSKNKSEDEKNGKISRGDCKGLNCHNVFSPNYVYSKSSSSPLSIGPPSSNLDISKISETSLKSSSIVGMPGNCCGTSNNGKSYLCNGGSICLGGICVCRPGFAPLNGLCQISKVELGERCFINEQCKDNGICINEICRCQSDDSIKNSNVNSKTQTNSFHNHKCIKNHRRQPLASVGDDCSNDQNNCGFNSICGKFSGVCECPVGMERNKTICVAAQRPRGTQCISSSDCNFHAFCDNGFCICLANYYPIGDGYCLPPALAIVEEEEEENFKDLINPDLLEFLLLKKQNWNNNREERRLKRNSDLPKSFNKINNTWSLTKEKFEQSVQQQLDRNNKTLISPKMPQLSSTFTTNDEKEEDEEIFASETISSPELKKEEIERKQRVSAPGTQCDICMGGSTCVEGLCLCPAGTRPSLKSENCETFEQRKSFIQEEQNVKKEYSKLTNKQPKMMGPIDRPPYARPSESCENREICTGGSICLVNSKVCECPPNKPILRNHICIQSDEPPMLKVVNALPGEKCNSETNCEGESVCVEETCRCQNNKFTPKSGTCKRRSADDEEQKLMPIPSQLENSFYDNILPPIQLPEENAELTQVNRPRISGPLLKKHSSSSSSSIISDILPQFVKNEPTEKGVCPPGNLPTISRSNGQLIKCNGMTPKCPPKSYCFVTGDASETYNCCKSY